MYYIYKLLDYKGFPFYIGITKNIRERINEHMQCGGNNTPKNYRVRRSIDTHGTLKFTFDTRPTLAEARKLEEQLITQFKHQLVNVQHGKQPKKKAKTRKSPRAKQCPHCLNWYRRLKAHKCTKEE